MPNTMHAHSGGIENALRLGAEMAEALEANDEVACLCFQLDDEINRRIETSEGDRQAFWLAEKLRIKRELLDATVPAVIRRLRYELATLAAE